MMKLIICGVLLSITVDVLCISDYKYHPKAESWFKVHKVASTWSEAFFKCHDEGAVLASPLTEELLEAMNSLIGNLSISYFTGTHARFSPGQFVSVEGVPLENMPVSDMYQVLHLEDRECLAMNGYELTVVSCLNKLPYICYKSYDAQQNLTECGTYDKEYKLEPSTGSCYKVHEDLRSWPDAYALCIAEGGYLAILNDEKEATIVQSKIPNKKLSFGWDSKWDPLYIGLRDWNANMSWLSIHGETMDQLYSLWDDLQPDATGQSCGAMLRNGKLDNVWCKPRSFFICEKEPQHIRYSLVEESQYFVEPRK